MKRFDLSLSDWPNGHVPANACHREDPSPHSGLAEEPGVRGLALPWRAAPFFADGEPLVWPVAARPAIDHSWRQFWLAFTASAALAALAVVAALVEL